MLRAILIVLALTACEKRSPREEPRPVPRDATVIEVDARVDDERAAALDRLYTYFSTTKRERSPVEADETLTNAYRDWMFAYAYARVGMVARARALAAGAREALAPVEDEPVHAVLGKAFAARVEGAIAGRSARVAMAPDVEAELARLERVQRYAVDRLRESSQILGHDGIDAIGAFAHGRPDARGVGFETLEGVADPVARARILTALVDGVAAIEAKQRIDGVAGVLEEARRLPAAQGKELLARGLAAIDAVPAADRGRVYVTAMALAAAVDPARVAALAEPTGAAIVALEPWKVGPALEVLVRALAAPTYRDARAAIWKRVEPVALAAATKERTRAAFAAGLLQLGDARALDILAALEGGERSLVDELDLRRALVLAHAQRPAAERIPAIERLARKFPEITDSFSTNRYFALSVLALIDIILVGIVDE